jgi:prephenate dehydrogenase
MGGSLARELSSRGTRVTAHDIRLDALDAALRERIVHARLDDGLTDVAEAEVVVIATPVDVAIDALNRIAPHLADDTVVTDVGSVKGPIVARAEAIGLGERFVGSHPLAGDHRSGWAASRAGLYADTTVFLSPTSVTTPESADRVERLWTAIGARTMTIGPEDHDRRMAWISHLPQLLSSALAGSLRQAALEPRDLGPGGRDMTRLAGSSAEMWSAICRANSANLATALDDLLRRLQRVREALDDSDPELLRAFFQDARDWTC